MKSDATSDGTVRWRHEVDQVINKLSKEAKTEWWRVVQFLYRGYMRNNRSDFSLQFDLLVNNNDLAPHDDIILQEISKQAGAVIVVDGGTLFDRKFGPDIQDDIRVAHQPGAYVIPNPRIEYLYHKLRDQIRHKPSQTKIEARVLNRSGLTLDLVNATLSYRHKSPKPINPSNSEIKMLACLMELKSVVPYTELGRATNVNAYNEQRDNESETLREAIHVVKAALIKALKKAGIPKDTANAMIKIKPKIGYQFVDQSP
jgi:alkylated DNA nucleotide flippase Atl1